MLVACRHMIRGGWRCKVISCHLIRLSSQLLVGEKKNEMEIMASFGIFFGVKNKKRCISTLNMDFNFDL